MVHRLHVIINSTIIYFKITAPAYFDGDQNMGHSTAHWPVGQLESPPYDVIHIFLAPSELYKCRYWSVCLLVCWSVCGHFVIFQLIKLIEQIELNKY